MCDFDVLKVDRAFIKDMVGAGETAPIARAILAMARILDLEVIAEGVETVHQVASLREMGCRLAEGDYYSPPVDLDDLATLLHREYKQDECGVIVRFPRAAAERLAPEGAQVWEVLESDSGDAEANRSARCKIERNSFAVDLVKDVIECVANSKVESEISQ